MICIPTSWLTNFALFLFICGVTWGVFARMVTLPCSYYWFRVIDGKVKFNTGVKLAYWENRRYLPIKTLIQINMHGAVYLELKNREGDSINCLVSYWGTTQKEFIKFVKKLEKQLEQNASSTKAISDAGEARYL